MGAGSESEPRQGNLELGLNEAVARPRVDGIIAEHLEAEGAVVLCAGAGMGKTMAAEERVRAVREAGGSAIHLRLSGRAPSSAGRSIRDMPYIACERLIKCAAYPEDLLRSGNGYTAGV